MSATHEFEVEQAAVVYCPGLSRRTEDRHPESSGSSWTERDSEAVRAVGVCVGEWAWASWASPLGWVPASVSPSVPGSVTGLAARGRPGVSSTARFWRDLDWPLVQRSQASAQSLEPVVWVSQGRVDSAPVAGEAV